MNLDALFHSVLTSGMKLSDPEPLRKFKVANGFQLVFIMAAPFLGLFYFYLGALHLFYASVGAGLLMVSSFLLLRVTKNLALGSHYAILIFWAWLLFLSWHTGAVSNDGVLEPTFIMNGGLILLAVFLLGYSGGTVWATIVFLEAGLVVYLHRSGYPFPNLIPPDIGQVYSLGTYLVSLLCILLSAFLFEKERVDAMTPDRAEAGALRKSGRATDDTPASILDRNDRDVQWNDGSADPAEVPEEEIPKEEDPGKGETPGQIEEKHVPPVFGVDPQANVTQWNEGCEREYGYSASEMIGKSIFTLVSRNYKVPFEETIAGVLDGKSITGRPFKYYTRDGKPVYVVSEAHSGEGAEGNGRECVVINTDVTKLRLKMKKLESHASEIREKLQSIMQEHDLLKRNIDSFLRKKDEGN